MGGLLVQRYRVIEFDRQGRGCLSVCIERGDDVCLYTTPTETAEILVLQLLSCTPAVSETSVLCSLYTMKHPPAAGYESGLSDGSTSPIIRLPILGFKEDSPGSLTSTFMMGVKGWPRSAVSDVLEAAISSGEPFWPLRHCLLELLGRSRL